MQQIGDIKGTVALARPIIQVLEIQDEDPKQWLPEDIVDMLDDPELIAQAMQQQQAEAQAQEPLMTDAASMEEKAKNAEAGPAQPGKMGANTVVPQNEVSNPMRASDAQVMKPR